MIISFTNVDTFFARGALTDKLKKEDKEPPKGTRLEVGTKLKFPLASFSDFDELVNDEKYWAVRDVLDKIAEKKGLLLINLTTHYQWITNLFLHIK